MDREIVIHQPPLYLIGMKIHCWKCQARMPAVALMFEYTATDSDAVGEDEENEEMSGHLTILSDTTYLPTDILKYVQGRVPTFEYRYSKTVRSKYYANTCPGCNMISGDFFLHSEPGAPFFPTTEQEASELYLTEVPFEYPARVSSSLSFNTGYSLITDHAKRIT